MPFHELVRELTNTLPLEIEDAAFSPINSPTVELELLQADRRRLRTQASVVRPSQANFRESVLARYGGEYCERDGGVPELKLATRSISARAHSPPSPRRLRRRCRQTSACWR
ncbi:hypothetical protein EMIT0P258_40275 [Pseudomonas sp. IT-P258]